MKEIITSNNRSEKEYFEHRVQYKVNIYTKLAHRFKWTFWIVATISMICAAIVPVLINNHYEELATVLSIVVSITVGLQSIYRFRQHWKNYDIVSSELRHEEMLFSTQSGIYAKNDANGAKSKFQIFVERFEALIENEREETILMRTSDKKETVESNNQIL